MLIGFVVYALMGILFAAYGAYCFFAVKPQRFWANIKAFEVNDVKEYNKAMGKLWIFFGLCLAGSGLFLLKGEDTYFVLIPILIPVLLAIVMMAVYTVVIEEKYRKR